MWKRLIEAWRSDNLLDQAWKESYEMLEIDRRMFLEAVRILRESDDVELNEDVRKLVKQVNRYERDVRRKVMTHCTVTGPAELPSGMTLVSIVIDIERVGDYCKNIVDLARQHPRRLNVEVVEARLRKVEREVRERFDETIEVLRDSDVEQAREMMRTYRAEIGAICDDITGELVQTQSGVAPGDAVAMALYVRHLKRIGAHLHNVVSSVVNPFHRIGYKAKDAKPDEGA